jgi:hypothetical protein
VFCDTKLHQPTSVSSSDIQKKLRALLPRDYAKDFRKFRPSDEKSMNLRLERLLEHRKRRYSSKAKTAVSNDSQPFLRGSSELFEGPPTAFRNCRDATDPSFTAGPISLSANSAESQLVVPSLLLLDGSSISGATLPNLDGKVDCPRLPGNSRTHYQKSDRSLADKEDEKDSKTDMVEAREGSPSRLIHHALEEQLIHLPRSIVRHVHSVLRYSSTNSWRSSVSWCSSWLSRNSFVSLTQSVGSSSLSRVNHLSGFDDKDEQRGSRGLWRLHNDPKATFGQSPPSAYPEDEERVWKLWNEEEFGSKCDADFLPFVRRFCCAKGSRNGSCKSCGAMPIHYHARYSELVEIATKLCQFINHRDRFDNTPLHFAAAAPNQDPNSILKLLQMGADMQAINTAGSTFFHLLLGHVKLDQLGEYLDLLRYLAAHAFPFSLRDYHGRTPLHVLLRRQKHLRRDTIGIFEAIFDIFKPDIDALDNFGTSVRHQMSQKCKPDRYQSRWRDKCDIVESLYQDLLSTHSPSLNRNVDFLRTLSGMSCNWTTWVGWVALDDRHTWIDINGDTALISLLKFWPNKDDELTLSDVVGKLLGLGLEIHARDRNGNTALAVAAIKGLRPVVTTLLGFGASIHCRNYEGRPLLDQVEVEIRRTKRKKDGRQYAMVLSCYNLLVDFGASGRLWAGDQWLSKSSRQAGFKACNFSFMEQGIFEYEGLGSF